MNILVIGNGFDLAHGLPTKYRDFIYFTDRVIAYYEDKYKEEFTFTEMFCKYEKGVRNFCDNTSKKGSVEELISLTEDNCWYNYFREELRENEPCEENESYEKNEGWVDFEESISHVIQVMDRMRKRVKSQKNLWQTDIKLLGEIITKYENYKYYTVNDIKEIKERLLTDLNRLIRGLEIYLVEYVGCIDVSPKLPYLKGNVDCVLSFNYTDTYEKIYGGKKHKKNSIEYDYIHGKVKSNGNIKTCSLVLGIEEYLSDEEDKRKDNEYIQFKKFYQRIVKKTGCKYTDWIKENEESISIKAKRKNKNNVYIFGHSLDIKDGDIIARLINMPNTQTTIFYKDQKAFENQICNLVKILGENELIEKVHGINKNIVFVDQNEMT